MMELAHKLVFYEFINLSLYEIPILQPVLLLRLTKAEKKTEKMDQSFLSDYKVVVCIPELHMQTL